MFDASEYWITVVEMPSYETAIDQLLTPEEADGLITFLARHPDDGTIIPETGGLRKLPWPARGKQRGAGAQVIYYFRDLNMPLYLVTALAKGDRVRMTKAEKAAMRNLVEAIVATQWRNQVSPLVNRHMKAIS